MPTAYFHVRVVCLLIADVFFLLLFFRGVAFTDGLKCFVKRNFLIFFLLPFLNIKFFVSCYRIQQLVSPRIPSGYLHKIRIPLFKRD